MVTENKAEAVSTASGQAALYDVLRGTSSPVLPLLLATNRYSTRTAVSS